MPLQVSHALDVGAKGREVVMPRLSSIAFEKCCDRETVHARRNTIELMEAHLKRKWLTFTEKAKGIFSSPDREAMEYDVAMVGAGPAGLAAAIRLKQLSKERGHELSVCVLEKGAEVGAHILSGMK